MPKKAARDEPFSRSDNLRPDPQNANRGTLRGRSLLEDSLRKYGAGRSIVTDRNGIILAGNKTAEVAVGELGMPTTVVETDGRTLVVVRRTDLDLDEGGAARELAFADNRVGELSLDWDPEVIQETLADGAIDLTELGLFTQAELDDILAGLDDGGSTGGPTSTEIDPDTIPGPGPRPRTRPGDLWSLGPHKLFCGDARDPASWKKLLGQDQAALVVTSPPYADRRKYDETTPFRPVPPEEYLAWYKAVALNALGNLRDDGSYFLNIKAHCEGYERLLYVYDLVLAHKREWGWLYIDEFAWTKNAVPGGWPNRFKNGWEPVYHFSKGTGIVFRPENVLVESDQVFAYSPDNPKSKTGFNTNNGNRVPGMARPSNVLHIGNETGLTEVHSAPFPVALPEFFIKAFSDLRDLVVDPFSGAGSTIIACARTNRQGRGIELSPTYCDQTLDRYMLLTNDDPIRYDGARWSQVRETTEG